MKKILSIALLFLAVQLKADSFIESNIQKVKVFRQNAEITRTVSTSINPGRPIIVLTGISTAINPSSLQIKLKNANAELLTAKYERNYLIPKKNNPKIDGLISKSEELSDELAWLTEQKNALVGMEEILKKNQELGAGKAGFTPRQVVELSNNYKKKFLEVKKELRELKKEEKILRKQLNRTNNQLNEMKAAINNPSGNIVLHLTSNRNERLQIECSYTVNQAGWSPLYDLRSSGISKNIKLNYRANIYQNTGIDWDNVDLTVSTGNPTQSNERPILRPLYAKIVMPYKGGKTKSLNESVLNMAMANDDMKRLSMGYTAHAQISEQQTNVEFNVSNNQSIQSDGKKNLIALNTYNLPTNYIYHAVPKICNGAFLLAKISDWGQYNLLPGQANIFFEGAFVGTSTINPEITSDTMLVSLGRDNGIVIKRNPIERYTEKKNLMSNRKETVGFELVVRNNKSEPVKIEVMDQVPISQNNKIQISLNKKGDAKHVKKYGKLLWTTTISPNNSWKDEFVYTVKYPRNNAIAGLK